MRYSLTITALYLAGMTCFVYGVLDKAAGRVVRKIYDWRSGSVHARIAK